MSETTTVIETTQPEIVSEAAPVETPKEPEAPRFLGTALLSTGRVEVWLKDGKQETRDIPLPNEIEIATGWTERKVRVFSTFCAVCDLIENDKTRRIPATNSEVENYLPNDKKILKQLEGEGVIEYFLGTLTDRRGNKMGGRLMVFLTPKGKAIREMMFPRKVSAATEETPAITELTPEAAAEIQKAFASEPA